ncbi:MAG: purine-binding chemotaxis protein CheW [Lachnospiraceae bacterium]|nr:purine-binding chemotaxis protein CheW [Lachnospiraceae bacterium]
MDILEFKLSGNTFGIPVDMVREIIPYQDTTPVPNSNTCVEGIFMPRDVIITAIDLSVYLKRDKTPGTGLFVITNYRNLDVAFHVEAALGIIRPEESEIASLDNTLGVDEAHIAKGVIRYGDHLTILLDFDKIIAQIQPDLLSEEEMATLLG